MNKQLLELQRELSMALKAEQAAAEAAKDWQADYDAKLAEFEAQHKDLVKSRDAALEKHTESKNRVKEVETKARELLGDDFIDEDLPLGFTQKKTKEVHYESQGFVRVAAKHFQWLLRPDEKLVNQFFTAMAKENKQEELELPESIRSLVSVEVRYVPQANISKSTLAKLTFTDSPDAESASEKAEKHLEQFAEENNIDPNQPTDKDSAFIVPEDLEEIMC